MQLNFSCKQQLQNPKFLVVFVGDVVEVEEVENQFHKMIDIFIDLVDRECCGFIIAS